MKKFLVHIFIFFYMVSYLKPFIPSVCNMVSKEIWSIQHQCKIKNIEARINILEVLADMAKHNCPKQDNNSQPDSFKLSCIAFAAIIPQINSAIFLSAKSKKQFTHYVSTTGLDFSTLDTPPPKVA